MHVLYASDRTIKDTNYTAHLKSVNQNMASSPLNTNCPPNTQTVHLTMIYAFIYAFRLRIHTEWH